MIEYEIPFVCLIFTILISIVFFSRKKIELKENYYYKNILIFTLLVNITNLVSHYMASIYAKNEIPNWFSIVFSNINKLGSLFIVIITTNLLSYILYITFEKYRKNFSLLKKINFIFYLIAGILIFILEFNVYKIGGVTSGEGSSVIFTFTIVFLDLILSFLVALSNIKKFDKRYYSIYMIISLISILGLFVMYHPQFNIYDLILCLMCYLMYFTIENPDLKMIEQLNLAKDHAEKANRAKSDFLSSMSHEIRTPLNAIVGFSQCILEEDNLDNAKEDAKDIVTASQNLLEIVNGILDISKIEADKMEIIEVNYNPCDNFEKLAKLMIPRIGEKPIELKTKFASDLPATLYGDVSKVKQIVTNILTNAVKYTDKGEINFEVNCVNDHDESKLIISIEDTGRGIKPEKIDKLFNKFERLEEDRNTTTEGTGLGLAITKRLVEMMGGKIVVQSKYGEGSKFTVYLKQKIISLNQEIIDTKIDIDNYVDEYPNKKVLVVDDNKINIKVAERLLRDYKVVVDSVESGYECLELIKSGKQYDLILLDDMMPKMSGVETLKELKKIEGYRVPTVALTANAISGMREKYLNDGFDDYLSKPMDKSELKRILSTFLSNGNKPSIFEPLPQEIYEIDDQTILSENTKNFLDENRKLYQHNPDTSSQFSSVYIDKNEDVETSFYHNQDYLKQNGIDIDKGLELLGDLELYNETFDNFIIQIDNRLKDLEKYQKQNDMDNYAILAHATKSDAKYLGFTNLVELAYRHEIESKNNNIEYIRRNFSELIGEINRIVEVGNKYLSKR